MKSILYLASIAIVASSTAVYAADSRLSKALNLGQLIGIAEACKTPVDTPSVLGYFMDNDLMDAEFNAAFENAKTMSSMEKPSALSCEVNALTMTRMQLD